MKHVHKLYVKCILTWFPNRCKSNGVKRLVLHFCGFGETSFPEITKAHLNFTKQCIFLDLRKLFLNILKTNFRHPNFQTDYFRRRILDARNTWLTRKFEKLTKTQKCSRNGSPRLGNHFWPLHSASFFEARLMVTSISVKHAMLDKFWKIDFFAFPTIFCRFLGGGWVKYPARKVSQPTLVFVVTKDVAASSITQDALKKLSPGMGVMPCCIQKNTVEGQNFAPPKEQGKSVG